jgi:hypothetical protein
MCFFIQSLRAERVFLNHFTAMKRSGWLKGVTESNMSQLVETFAFPPICSTSKHFFWDTEAGATVVLLADELLSFES